MIETALDGTDGTSGSDKIFLLSAEEAEKYYDVLHETKTCWWLRTPGIFPGTMGFVYTNKNVMASGYDVRDKNFTLKPAIWVSLK